MCLCMITVNWISRSEAALSFSDLLMQCLYWSPLKKEILMAWMFTASSSNCQVCGNLQWTSNYTASHLMLQKPGYALAVVDH